MPTNQLTSEIAVLLPKLYLEQKLSLNQIGERLSKHNTTIGRWLMKLGIPRRGLREGLKLRKGKPKPSRDRLVELYWGQKLSLEKTAKILGVSRETVTRWLREENIRVRGTSEVRKGVPGPRGPKAFGWKGGRRDKGDGYVHIYAPSYHRHDSQGYVPEHIMVWEKVHQKRLPEGYVIHHLNGIRDDNRPENLVALPKSGHTRREMAEVYKKRIRQLEVENRQLKRALEDAQMIFYISEN